MCTTLLNGPMGDNRVKCNAIFRCIDTDLMGKILFMGYGVMGSAGCTDLFINFLVVNFVCYKRLDKWRSKCKETFNHIL